MRRIGFLVMAALLAGCAAPPEPAPAVPRIAAARTTGAAVLRDKTLPLVGLIEHDAPTLAAMRRDPDLAAVGAAYRARLAEADRSCGFAASCLIAAGKLTPAESARIEATLRNLAERDADVRRFADGPLKADGMVATHDADAAPARLAAAWRNTAAMMADMISVYGEKGPTRYPSIDGMRLDPASPDFGRMARTLTGLMVERHHADELFLDAPADFALSVMETDGRDEAGRHEPLLLGENRAAAAALSRIDWARYPYSAILVPGLGPDVPDQALHPGGRLRLRLALERFRAGAAPFLIVSGGYVHPARTPWAEAIEMKRALMADYGVPESAIIVDPHARHTTTNVRNAVRLLARMKAPLERKVLIVSEEGQIAGVAADTFDERNRTETGVVPYRSKKRLSRFEVEIEPSRDALELNPTDPLDP